MNTVSYVINLKSRPDRLKSVTKRFSSIDEKFERVDAITGEANRAESAAYVAPPNVVANWKSHLECYKRFLITDAELCFIFEDDVEFKKNIKLILNQLRMLNEFNFDIFQFGYLGSKLKFGVLQTFQRKIQYLLLRTCLLILTVLPKSKTSKIKKKIELREQKMLFCLKQSRKLQLKGMIIPGFVSGTHAYAIGRDMAQKLLSYNNPTILGADLALQILSMSGNWIIYRTPRTFAIQDNSSVSIGEHNSIGSDLGLVLIGEKE